MKLRVFVYRLAAALTAFILGVGFFSVWQYFQTPEKIAVAALPLSKQQAVFAPPPVEPIVVTTDANWEKGAKEEDVKEEADAQEDEEFDPDGYYYVSYDDKLPKGFEDFDMISITTTSYATVSEENDDKGTSIPPEGNLRTKTFYNFARIYISEKNMAFETVKVDGVSYTFRGKFIEKAPFWRLDPQTPVLAGRLVKTVKGKKAAEAKVNLIWYAGC